MMAVDVPPLTAAGMDDRSEQSLAAFRRIVLEHYRLQGRDLPWRRTRDPYRILVSEMMLQQTQVARVVPKYEDFVTLFPDLWGLAGSPTAAVLSAWQGLGYNRRGLALQRTAQMVICRFEGHLPRSAKALCGLPGIGPATAGAIMAFAYGLAVPFIETNIRAALLHHFFPGREGVSDREILALVEATLDRDDPRTWYYALMDYGSWLKQTGVNPSRRSRHHVRQTPFEGSRRQLRAQILRLFLAGREAFTSSLEADTAIAAARPADVELSAEEVAAFLPEWQYARVRDALERLAAEGFLSHDEACTRFALA